MLYLPGQYHTWYQEQMSHWPEQAVNIIMKWLTGRNPSLVVADFGCGESLLNYFSIANYSKENLLNILEWNLVSSALLICSFVSLYQGMHALLKM